MTLNKNIGILCLLLLTGGGAWGQVYRIDGFYSTKNSQIFSVGDIVEYGKTSELDKEKSLSPKYRREKIIRRWLNNDSTLLSMKSDIIHDIESAGNKGRTLSGSLSLLKIIDVTSKNTKTDSLSLKISGGSQTYHSGDTDDFDSVLKLMPTDRLLNMYNSKSNYMFVNNVYYIDSGRIFQLKDRDYGNTVKIKSDSTASLSVNYKKPLSKDSVVFRKGIPAAYCFHPISKDKLYEIITSKPTVEVLWYNYVLPGTYQSRTGNRVCASLYGATAAAGIGAYAYAEYRTGRDDFRYLKNRQIYETMKYAGLAAVALSLIVNAFDISISKSRPLKISHANADTYGGMSLTYNF